LISGRRFEFNKAPNPSYKPGKFQLAIEGGIAAYKAPRPAVVAISSAGEAGLLFCYF
jgi:hypothetical protein